MPRSTESLLDEYADQAHPLGLALKLTDVPQLIADLRQRLDANKQFLDGSVASLRQLDKLLVRYGHRAGRHSNELSDAEVIRLIRETAAYVGEVLVTHTDARWFLDVPYLSRSGVMIAGPWEVVDDETRDREISPHPTAYMLGLELALLWDRIQAGEKPRRLASIYRQIKSKHLPRIR